MKIIIETIPHAKQDYDTIGNYWRDRDGTIHIKVSELGNEQYETMAAVHELVELILCRSKNISDEEITKFDVEFEHSRMPGDVSEPGDHPRAPYQSEHCFATGIERLLCAALGIKWADYELACQCVC